MFTFGVLYLALYILTMLSIFVFCFLKFPIYCLTQWSIPTLLSYIVRYSKLKNIFFYSMFSLTGLPPVGLFFVKFNILTFLFYQVHIVTIVTLFFIFFVNMLYYTQMFRLKNNKKKMYSIHTKDIFSIWKNHYKHSNKFENILTYKIVYYNFLIIIISCLAIFIFGDIFIIFRL